MRLYRAQQMRDADARAAAAGVPTARLMDAAGAAVAEALLERFPHARPVVVLCGSGNNGGDGFVAAKRLERRGIDVRLYELAGAGERPGDAAEARRAFRAAGGRAARLDAGSYREVLALLEAAHAKGQAPVVVDALFGIGLDRPLDGWLAELVAGLNDGRARVVAVDVPSGLDADLARPIGPHVRADLTVELAGHKPAALFYPARAAYGEARLADIGVPPEALEASSEVALLTPALVRRALPDHAPDAHKYQVGSVCVVAGSQRYLGAAELACRGAWRGGAGLVTLVARERLAGAWPETILEPHAWESAAWPPPGLTPRRAGACVVGPGLDEAALPRLPDLLAWAPGPVVLDAAALAPAALAAAGDLSRAVLTPHAGEAARLLGGEAELLERDPLAAAARLAERYAAIVVLKGPTSVIAAPDGRQAVSTRGAPALASGGTGDVLAGLLGALLAAPGGGEAAFERVCLGVWAHGVAGELAAAERGYGLVASDVAERLPAAFQQLSG